MNKQFSIFAVSFVLSANASAFDFGSFFEQSLMHEAEYNYADASLLLHPDSFKGLEINGSYTIRPNLAITGVFNRTSADVLGIDNALSQLGVGLRYFYALPNIEYTDLDLSLQWLNNSVDVGRISDSSSLLVVGAQARHVLGMPVGSTSLMWQEAYGGLQLGVSSEDFSVAFHAGVLVEINAQFSAKAELLLDDGAFLTLGARMNLGRVQRNPESGTYKANLPSEVVQPAVAKPQVSEPVLPVVISPSEDKSEKLENPYGLTEEEMSDLKKAAE